MKLGDSYGDLADDLRERWLHIDLAQQDRDHREERWAIAYGLVDLGGEG